MKNKLLRAISITMAVSMLTMTPSLTVSAQDYQDKSAVLDTGFTLDTDYTLKLANPSKDTSTTAENYYITGSSDPDYPLTCNGEEVEDRGIYGSFGIYAPLEMGDNTFTFQNGDDTQTVTITRTKAATSGGISTITDLKRLNPSSDDVANSGEEYRIRCTAPANGKVTATLGGKTYTLEQEAIATTGVEAYYSKTITLPEVEDGEVENLGQIKFKLTFEGKTTSATSDGSLYVLGKGAHLLAKVNQNAAVLYEEASSGANHVSLVSRGAVDSIVDAEGDYFKLSMGSWINKSYVDILKGDTEWKNKVSQTSYQSGDNGEYLILEGTASPIFKAYNTSEKITIKFYNTSGVKAQKLDSELFSSMKVTTSSGDTTIELNGAVDSIVDAEGDYFKLSMGSWINKSYVDILKGDTEWKNKVSQTSYQSGDNGEYLILEGTASPIFKAYNTSEKITIKFYNTSGVKAQKLDSELFSSMKVTTSSGDTTIELNKKDGADTVGYDISFDGKGKTTIFFNPKAEEGSSAKPLSDMTIVVDPGHGGLDGGAQGVLYGNGPVEKDINMAHALVLKNRLESLGAEVILAVQPDQDNSQKVEMTDRVEMARENEADFYISLHCNSIDASANGLKPSGTEIYYYENNSKLLADDMLEKITEYNDRDARSVIYGNFYVTRNPLCPSMLVEMGFISNPVEYDELCSPDSMYQTANAIADALIDYVG